MRFKSEEAYAKFLREHPTAQATAPEPILKQAKPAKAEYDVEKLEAYVPLAKPDFITPREQRSSRFSTFVITCLVAIGVLAGLSTTFWTFAWMMQTWREFVR